MCGPFNISAHIRKCPYVAAEAKQKLAEEDSARNPPNEPNGLGPDLGVPSALLPAVDSHTSASSCHQTMASDFSSYLTPAETKSFKPKSSASLLPIILPFVLLTQLKLGFFQPIFPWCPFAYSTSPSGEFSRRQLKSEENMVKAAYTVGIKDIWPPQDPENHLKVVKEAIKQCKEDCMNIVWIRWVGGLAQEDFTGPPHEQVKEPVDSYTQTHVDKPLHYDKDSDDPLATTVFELTSYLRPLAIALNIAQAADTRLYHILVTLGRLYQLFDDPNIDPEVRIRVLASLELRWRKSDQDAFILAIFFHPYIRCRLFSPNSPDFCANALYTVVQRVFERVFQKASESGLFEAFMSYYNWTDEFSAEAWHLKEYSDMYKNEGKDINLDAIWSTLPCPERSTRVVTSLVLAGHPFDCG
ncbi:hypothetical protein RhiTH_005517 [Rhizoctonia solani]